MRLTCPLGRLIELETRDANGNLLSDGCHSYRYDSQNRLVEVLEEGITYTYDPFHRRLSKTTPQATIRFLWDGDHEIGSVDASGKIQELRILGEGLEAEIGAAILIELQGEAYVPLHDHRGALIALLPLTGQESHTYRYASFGQELTGNTFCPWLFSSKRLDPETGFLFFGRRYYSPSLARWTTPDPAGFPDGPNRYAYVQNRPLTQLDPYGLFGWNDCWNFTKGFGRGLGDSLYGLGAGMVSMGEWLHADFQYEHFNDASYFQDKSQRAASQWSALGQECCALTQRFSDRPLNTLGNALGQVFTPGLMQLCNLSSNASTEQWGHAFATASLDLAILPSSVMKACQVGRGLGAVELLETKFFRASHEEVLLPHSITSLMQSGKMMDRGGLTRAGRSLEKHGGRCGSLFSKPTGNLANKNLEGQYYLRDILTHPNKNIVFKNNGYEVIFQMEEVYTSEMMVHFEDSLNKAQLMIKKFTITLCSDVSYEEMVADICYENNTVAMVTQENGIDKMEIEVFSPPKGAESWKFSLDDFEGIIHFAKKNLISFQKLPD